MLIRDGYAYFEKLHETGYISIQNHTVTHPLAMPSLYKHIQAQGFTVADVTKYV